MHAQANIGVVKAGQRLNFINRTLISKAELKRDRNGKGCSCKLHMTQGIDQL